MYKLFQNKRGFDKPIEIFVALFIILAVAMVILKMFSAQITGKTKELKDIEQEQSSRRAKQEAVEECNVLCTEALEGGCTPAKIAQYCMHFIAKEGEGIDLDGDGNIPEYNTELFGGIGLCEDRVYCFHLSECKCNVVLNIRECVKQLCNYWESQGITITDSNSMLTKYLALKAAGSTCDKSVVDPNNKDWTQTTTLTCS